MSATDTMNALKEAAITARAETLKEVIYFCEQEIYAYERLFSALGNPVELRGQVKTAKKIKEHYEQRLKETNENRTRN